MKALNKLNFDEDLFNERQALKSEFEELKLENVKWEKRFNRDYKQLINQLNYQPEYDAGSFILSRLSCRNV